MRDRSLEFPAQYDRLLNHFWQFLHNSNSLIFQLIRIVPGAYHNPL